MPQYYSINCARWWSRVLPVVESDQYGPIELVLRAVGLRTTGVDERVNGSQEEALLVKLLQLAWQLAHRWETQRGRPTWEKPDRKKTCETKQFFLILDTFLMPCFCPELPSEKDLVTVYSVLFFSSWVVTLDFYAWNLIFQCSLSVIVVVATHYDNAPILLFILIYSDTPKQ